MSERMFPLLLGYGKERREFEVLGVPPSIPWSIVAPHEARAQRNHGQSLAMLAERGGLCPSELLAVVEDRRWRSMSTDDAAQGVVHLLRPPSPAPTIGERSAWHRIGSAGNPIDVRDVPGGTATVARGEGGRWTFTLTLRGTAGDDAQARAAVDRYAAWAPKTCRGCGKTPCEDVGLAPDPDGL